MFPLWLHFISISALLLGFATTVVIIMVEARHPQLMWMRAETQRRVLVHDADCYALRLSRRLPGEMVAAPFRHQRDDVRSIGRFRKRNLINRQAPSTRI